MQIKLDKTYVKFLKYTILTATILYLLYIIISNLGIILKTAVHVLGATFSVLSPLIIALIIAYLLHPLVNWIDYAVLSKIKPLSAANKNNRHKHLRLTLSVVITYLLVVCVLVLIIYSLYILISGSLPRHLNLNSMILYISNYTQTYHQLFGRLNTSLQASGLSSNLKSHLLGFFQSAQIFIGNAVAGMFSSLRHIGNNLLNMLLGFVIAFYLLKDIDYFKNLYHDCTRLLFNHRHNEKFATLLTEINGVVASFIRGQLLVALIVGVTSSIALYIVGLDFAVLVGMAAGLFNIIPYFGPIIGSVIAIIVGLISGSPLKALFAVVALLVVHLLDSNIISPKIVGDSVGLHPVFIILSIVIGGSCFGLVGMLLAVPAAGIIKLLLIRLKDLAA